MPAATKRYGEFALNDAWLVIARPSDNAPEPFEWSGEIEDIISAPPESVALCRKGARWIERSVDKQQTSVLGESGMTQSREKRRVTWCSVHGVA